MTFFEAVESDDSKSQSESLISLSLLPSPFSWPHWLNQIPQQTSPEFHCHVNRSPERFQLPVISSTPNSADRFRNSNCSAPPPVPADHHSITALGNSHSENINSENINHNNNNNNNSFSSSFPQYNIKSFLSTFSPPPEFFSPLSSTMLSSSKSPSAVPTISSDLFYNQSSSSSSIPSLSQLPPTSHSFFHSHPRLSSFPMHSHSNEFSIDPSQISHSHRIPSASAPDMSKTLNAGLQNSSNLSSQGVFFSTSHTLQPLEQSDLPTPSSGGSIHSEFSNPTVQTKNGSPRFDNLCLDYGIHHTSDAASIASMGSSTNLSSLSYQYDHHDQPSHSSPASFSIRHSRHSSISSIAPDPTIQPTYSLADFYSSPLALEPFSDLNRTLDLEIPAQARKEPSQLDPLALSLGNPHPKLDSRLEEQHQVKSDQVHSSFGALSSLVPEIKYTSPAETQSPYTFKPPTLNISTDLSVGVSTYLDPNDALKNFGGSRRSPARQRSRSEGDLLTRLLMEAQSGTNADRQMLKDDAGVQKMAAIALSPKTPVQFHAEKKIQFPLTHLAISHASHLESTGSHIFLNPSIMIETRNQGLLQPVQDSLDSPTQSRRRRAVSASRLPSRGSYFLTENDMTPNQHMFNQMLPFERPFSTEFREQQTTSSPLPPQIILSSEFECQGSPGQIPDLTPEFVLPPEGGKMDLDDSSSSKLTERTGFESQFLPFQPCLTAYKPSSVASSPNLSQVSYAPAPSGSEDVSFDQVGAYQISGGSDRVRRPSEVQISNSFDSRPPPFESFARADCPAYQPMGGICSPAIHTYHPYDKNTSQYSQPQTGWSVGPEAMNRVFGIGLESAPNHGTETSGSNLGQEAPRKLVQPKKGGRGSRKAAGTSLCIDCGATFTRKDRLRYHIDSQHLKLQPHLHCEVPGCEKAFRQRSDLSRHVKFVHRDLQRQKTESVGDRDHHLDRRRPK